MSSTSYEIITRQVLDSADKKSFSDLSVTFGLVLVCILGLVFVRENFYVHPESVNIQWALVITFTLVFLFAIQVVSVSFVTQLEQHKDKKSNLELVISQTKGIIQGLQENIDQVQDCYSLNNIADQNNVPDITQDPKADCNTSTNISTSRLLCQGLTECTESTDCPSGTDPNDRCSYSLSNPNGDTACSNVCGNTKPTQLQLKIDDIKKELVIFESELQSKNTKIKATEGLSVASNIVTMLLMIFILVAFLVMANKLDPYDPPSYWDAGWMGTLLLVAVVSGSTSAHVISQQIKK